MLYIGSAEVRNGSARESIRHLRPGGCLYESLKLRLGFTVDADKIAKRVLVGGAIGILVVVVALLYLFGWGTRFPAIRDPARLRKDSLALLREHPAGKRVRRNAWPESIAELKPLIVMPQNGCLLLTLKGGGVGADPYGYAVAESTPAQVPQYIKLYETGHEGIFKCYWGRRYPEEESLKPNPRMQADAAVNGDGSDGGSE